MGPKSSRKGKRAEREIVALARSHGLKASREWHRAQSADARERVRDVGIGGDYYQVQVSAHGFERIYRELRGEWLVALRAADYLALLSVAPKIPIGGAFPANNPIVPLGGKR